MVAISGGGDSVALARGLLATRQRGEGKIVAAHFNHRLRGTESDADERFVADFCHQHRIPLRLGRFPKHSSGRIVSEERARNARYTFLRRAAETAGARYLVAGHTRDDQVETLMHRILRGTGLRGLAGIPRARPLGPAVVLLRPLLNFRREEIRVYLRSLSQPFREDLSNSDARFTRNRIRHELLPYVREHLNDRADEALLRLAKLAGQTQEFVEASAESLRDLAIVEESSNRLTLDRRVLRAQKTLLVRELLARTWRKHEWPLKNMTLRCWEDLAGMIGTDSGREGSSKRVFPGNILVEVQGERVILRRKEE